MVFNEHCLSMKLTTTSLKMLKNKVPPNQIWYFILIVCNNIIQWDRNMSLLNGKYEISIETAHYVMIGSHFKTTSNMKKWLMKFSAEQLRCHKTPTAMNMMSYSLQSVSIYFGICKWKWQSIACLKPTWINILTNKHIPHWRASNGCTENKTVRAMLIK